MQYLNHDKYDQFVKDITRRGFMTHAMIPVDKIDITRPDPMIDLLYYFEWYNGVDDPLDSFMVSRWLLAEAMQRNMKFPVTGYWSAESKKITLDGGSGRANAIAWTGASTIPMFYVFWYEISGYFPNDYYPIWDIRELEGLLPHMTDNDTVKCYSGFLDVPYETPEINRYKELNLPMVTFEYDNDKFGESKDFNNGFMKVLAKTNRIKVVISGSTLYDFDNCKSQIESKIDAIPSLNGTPIVLEFINELKQPYQVDYLVEKYDGVDEFVIGVDANVKWNVNIFEMIYWFDVNTIARSTYDGDIVVIYGNAPAGELKLLPPTYTDLLGHGIKLADRFIPTEEPSIPDANDYAVFNGVAS